MKASKKRKMAKRKISALLRANGRTPAQIERIKRRKNRDRNG